MTRQMKENGEDGKKRDEGGEDDSNKGELKKTGRLKWRRTVIFLNRFSCSPVL